MVTSTWAVKIAAPTTVPWDTIRTTPKLGGTTPQFFCRIYDFLGWKIAFCYRGDDGWSGNLFGLFGIGLRLTTIAESYSQRESCHLNVTENPTLLMLNIHLCQSIWAVALQTCAAGMNGFHFVWIVFHDLTVVGSQCSQIVQAFKLLSIDMNISDGTLQLCIEKYIAKTFQWVKCNRMWVLLHWNWMQRCSLSSQRSGVYFGESCK